MTFPTNKLHIPEGETFESVMSQKDNGGRFVIYEYLIPRPIIAPGRGASKIFFIRSGEKPTYNRRYNLITLLWGWWGLPFGIVYIPNAIANNKNGIDVTEDVYNNLTPEDFSQKRVVIKTVATVFTKPDKESAKELEKCIKKFNQKTEAFTEPPLTGLYIDIDNPVITIGLSGSDYHLKEFLEKQLYKYFYSRTKFRFLNLSDESELSEKMKKQCYAVKL